MRIVTEKIIQSQLLESPCYDEESRCLYFIDITNSDILKWDLVTDKLETTKTSGNVGALVLDRNKSVLISAEKAGLVEYSKDLRERNLVKAFDLVKIDQRFNDGIIDAKGRYIFGTKGLNQEYPKECKLFSFEDDSVSEILHGLTISNGMCFSEDGNILHHIDTPTGMLSSYQYDKSSGKIVQKMGSFLFESSGLPDGMTIDRNGNVWVAFWGGNKISRWNLAQGIETMMIGLPMKYVTSCCLADNENEIFITTGNVDDVFSIVYRIKL